ncbi:site-specific integrase [Cytobacillus firmus]|uniref:site-specific integrase n=1 Tax=Cytobacillus firmus TaxID=1399 RepID=UPI0018CED75F|nr:site-specific integrase [Cytobacillus firmus]MBG9590190.1 integrase [Cytobacillus firmus]
MNLVQPIRDLEKIQEVATILKKRSFRDYFLFVMGTQTGLRISDLLKLRVQDVRNRTHVSIIEKKTKKPKRFLLSPSVRVIINDYIEEMKDDDYLFQSRKGSNQPILRQRAYAILTGLEEIGTHTLRKTFGYHFYQRKKDVAMLQQLFNHSAPSITLKYIGITQDLQDKALEDFEIVDWSNVH